ncbi:hypothetical protein SXIM_52270 [Streptomyces xiamenensis]|uniref:Uncharacterized protein n=1 Tax=Streptomyces xiamenensis TaxID=408015 RepID=A0A0F7CQL3_9ACTN|nr:hypothetical protein SXIM_52270 [Streptomyces xiamenensis]
MTPFTKDRRQTRHTAVMTAGTDGTSGSGKGKGQRFPADESAAESIWFPAPAN